MAPITTDALVLHTFPYGETSRIIRLLTPGYGVQSVMAKGAMRPKSQLRSALQAFSNGSARFYFRQHRDLHTLAEFELDRQRPSLAGHVRRFNAASAVAEVVLRFAPTEPHPEIFEFVCTALDDLCACDVSDIETHALRALWGVIDALGFAPSLEVCARDGQSVPAGAAIFSIRDGGVLCSPCSQGMNRRPMPAEDRVALEMFLHGPTPELVDPRRLSAHRRLLERFVERHVAEGKMLPALELWGTPT